MKYFNERNKKIKVQRITNEKFHLLRSVKNLEKMRPSVHSCIYKNSFPLNSPHLSFSRFIEIDFGVAFLQMDK